MYKNLEKEKLEKLLELYQQEKPQLSPRTIQKYKSIVKMFIEDAENDDIIERSCQAWNEILSEDGFIENLCSREWSFLV
jgi:hypothetical protein